MSQNAPSAEGTDHIDPIVGWALCIQIGLRGQATKAPFDQCLGTVTEAVVAFKR